MGKVYYEEIKSNICDLLIAYTNQGLVRAKFNVNNGEEEFFNFLNHYFNRIVKNDSSSIYKKEIELYLTNDKKKFELPLVLLGTEFNKKVWQAIGEVPYGEVRTYKQIAELVGCPKGYRAVGNANNKNPIVLVLPCHRVIGSDGSLTGFAPGLKYKVELLKHEGLKPYIRNQKWYI